jgi:hypothetical protein
MSEKFEMPSEDKYNEFAEQMVEKIENAERLGLKDFSKLTALTQLEMQGIGMFYPAEVDEDGNTKPSRRNGKYHIASSDTIETMKWVEKHLWQNRMKDFAAGVMLFASNMIAEMSEGEHSDVLMQSKKLFKQEFPNDKEPSDFMLASYVITLVLEMILENEKAFGKMYEQVTLHEETELVTIGDIRTVSAIIAGGYTSDTITKEEAIDSMGKKVTDKDIEKFLQEISKNAKSEEE